MNEEAMILQLKELGLDNKCSIFRKMSAARVSDDAGGFVFYSPFAGGVYRSGNLLTPSSLTEKQETLLRAECFRINMGEGRIPSASELMSFATSMVRPNYWHRLDMLIWGIDKLSGKDGKWVDLGQSNPAAGHTGYENEASIDYGRSLHSMTASAHMWEVEQIVKDAVREGWVDTVLDDNTDNHYIRLTRLGTKRAETLMHPLQRGSALSLEKLLEAEEVIFVVDTNILIEFNPINKLPWSELCPNAKKIRVVIPSTVVKEIDNHKKQSGKVRRRAHEFAKIARELVKLPKLEYKNLHGVDISIELGPLYRNSQLDEDKFALDDNDRRIAAEAAKFLEANTEAILLTDDVNPARFFMEAGLPVCMPPRTPQTWLRGDPEND